MCIRDSFVAPADSFTVGNNTINDSPNTLSVGNFAQIPASSEGAVVVGNGGRRTLTDLTNVFFPLRATDNDNEIP